MSEKKKTTLSAGSEMEYGCLFCRSGSEEKIIREFGISHPDLSCLSPKRVRVRRQGEREFATLFPGYIFFRVSTPIDFRTIIQKSDIYRLLRYPNGDWKLAGSDLILAEWMFETGGVIGLSKARFYGDTVIMLSGPLKNYEKRIVKYDKRAKTAQVKIDFHGKELIIWLGFEIDIGS